MIGPDGGDAPLVLPTGEPIASAEPELTTYDPGPARERVRGVLALGSLGLVVGTAAGVFVLVFSDKSEQAQTFGQIVFSAVITLFGTVAGFYFGSRQGPGG